MGAFPMLRGAALLLALALSLPVMAQTALQEGQATEPFRLGPGEGRAFYLDVPHGTTHMLLELNSERAETVEDVDLLARFGEPFDTGSQLGPQVDYFAVGETGFEHLEITFASTPPVHPGRWHFLVVNARNDISARNVVLTAALKSETKPTLSPLKLEIAYTDPEGEGFNDPTPFQAQGGNDAATLGQARRRAFEAAIAMLEESFTSPVAVFVEASFVEREEDSTTLASAGVGGLANFPGARARNTWYAISIVPRLAGTDTCRVTSMDCSDDPEADVQIQFSPNPPSGWWYGLERSRGVVVDGYDFIAVAAHEMLHGLGFVSFADSKTGELAEGTDGTPRTDAYTSQLQFRKDGNFLQVDELTDSERQQAFTSRTELFWGGDYGDVFWSRRFSTQPKLPLYAPMPANPGSSVSHVNFRDIMHFQGRTPTNGEDINIREGGEELGAAWFMLRDAGWDEDSKLENLPRPGMWFDLARNGHGFDLQRAGDTWFLTFFSYGDDGRAEWYLGIGEIKDGVFTGVLERFTYDFGAVGAPPQSGTEAGEAVIDFTAGAESAVCSDGTDRSGAVQLAVFSWQIDGDSGDWCVQPLIASEDPTPPPDFTGHWWAGDADQGWGLTVYQQGPVLFAVLYYYDNEGNPRWALGSTGNWSNGDTITMQQIEGFCRTCEPTELGERAAGTLTLDLDTPAQDDSGGNTATVDVTWQESPGGTWLKENVPIWLLSDPAG